MLTTDTTKTLASFGGLVLFLLLFNPSMVFSQSADCDPRVDITASLTGNSSSQPSNSVLVYSGQSFRAPAGGGMADGIKVFFSFIRASVPLTLTLHQGTTPGAITPAIASASYMNGIGNLSDFPKGVPVCFEFDSPVSLVANGDYYFLVTTNCNTGFGCSIGTIIDTSNPYSDGNRFTASATNTGTRTGDLKFAVYSGNCDDEAPTVVANNITVRIEAGGYTLSQDDIDAIALGTTDNCPNFLTYSITSGQTAYTCADGGRTFRVTLTATDGCENTDSQSAAVTVLGDNIACPEPGMFQAGDDAGIAAWLASASANLCSLTGTSVSNDYDPGNFSGGDATGMVTFTLLNSANQIVDECQVSLTVSSAIPTMGQWGIFILAMLLLILGVVTIKNREIISI